MVERAAPAGSELLEDRDFVWSRVWPLVSGGDETPARSKLELTMHRSRADGRAVAEYRFDDSMRVFAKLYPDAAEGAGVFQIHARLRESGFGHGSPHSVAEPIAYLDEHALLLFRAADGVRLAGLETHDWAAFEAGVLRAGAWLAALHGSAPLVGPLEDVTHGVFRLARRAARATAERPDLGGFVRESLAELARRHATTAESGVRVQTHGRFHAGHVFLSPECVTAVDLDRAARADPAKDVGEFVHGLRSIGVRTGVVDEAVDKACVRFVDEYVRHGAAPPAGLAYYWSYCLLWTLLGLLLKDRPARPGWEGKMAFFRAEFEEAPARAAAWLRRD